MKLFAFLASATALLATQSTALDCYVGKHTSPAGNCPATMKSCFTVTTTMNVMTCPDPAQLCMLHSSDSRPMDGPLIVTGSCATEAACNIARNDLKAKATNTGVQGTIHCLSFGVTGQSDSYLTEATAQAVLATESGATDGTDLLATCFVGTESRSARQMANGVVVTTTMEAAVCQAGEACQLTTKDARPVDGPIEYVGSCATAAACAAVTPAAGETKTCYDGVMRTSAVQMKVGIQVVEKPVIEPPVIMPPPKTFRGYLTDMLCWQQPNHRAFDGALLNSNPEAHTIHCMLDLPKCLASGFGLLLAQVPPDTVTGTTGSSVDPVAGPDGGSGGPSRVLDGTTYYLHSTFDEAGNKMAKAALESMRKAEQEDRVLVTVVGTVMPSATAGDAPMLTNIKSITAVNSECTMTKEMKLCPDGTPAVLLPNCEWQSCDDPVMCTMEQKMCDASTPAIRNPDCSWQPCDGIQGCNKMMRTCKDGTVPARGPAPDCTWALCPGENTCFVGVEDPTKTTMVLQNCETSCMMSKVNASSADGGITYTGSCLATGATCEATDLSLTRSTECYTDISDAKYTPSLQNVSPPNPNPDPGAAATVTSTLISTVLAVLVALVM